MNNPTVVEPDIPTRVHRRLGIGIGVIVVALAIAFGLTSLLDLSGGPGTISRITFENPTVYALDIEVTSGPGAGLTSAGSVRQKSTADVFEVLDQGDVWIFRFDSQGATGGEVRLSRTELEATGWKVRIPDEVGKRLADAGAPPTP